MTNIIIAFISLISIVFVFIPLFKLKNSIGIETIAQDQIDNISNQLESIYEEIKNTITDHNLGNIKEDEFENGIRDYRIQAALLLQRKELLMSEIYINLQEIDAKVAGFIDDWNRQSYRDMEPENNKNDKSSV